MNVNIFYVVLFSLFITGQAGAQVKAGSIYRWVDAKGVVHYGDKPAQSRDNPKSESAIDKGDLNYGDNVDAQKKLANDVRSSAQQKREAGEADVAAKESAAKEAERLKSCATAKEVVRTYVAGGRIASVNEKGEKIVMDEQELGSKKEAATKAMEEACAPVPVVSSVKK